jgi:hypothetical protein
MMTIGTRIRSRVRSGLLVALAVGVTASPVVAGERHAASVLAVDAAGGGLVLDEFGVAGVRRTLKMSVAPNAEVLISEREEPVSNFYRPFKDTAISLAEVRPGDFVVVDVGGKPGMADRVIVTHRKAGS